MRVKKWIFVLIVIYIAITLIGIAAFGLILYDFYKDERPGKDLHIGFSNIPLKRKLVLNNSNGDFEKGLQILGKYSQTKKTDIISPTNRIIEIFKKSSKDINNWPYDLGIFLNNHLDKVFVTTNLNSSALVEFDPETEKFCVFLDSSTFFLSPNQWLNRTEFSLIDSIPNNVEMTYVIEKTDSTFLTISNILLHEIGHVVGFITFQVPNHLESYPDTKKFPLLTKEFMLPENYFVHKEKNRKFKALKFYSDQKLSFDLYVDLFSELEKTSFPTLYSTKDGQEYFAELFYSYFHCIVQSKPYKIKIGYENKEIEFENGIRKDRCKEEREKIELILKTLPNNAYSL